MITDLIGRGWHFPIALGANQCVALTNYENEIEQAIRIILGTAPGERIMRPDFGSRLHELVFEPLNNETIERVRIYVIDALERWEPRITIIKVETMIEPGNQKLLSATYRGHSEGCLLIHVHYEIKQTHDQRSLVYPFYLIPEE